MEKNPARRIRRKVENTAGAVYAGVFCFVFAELGPLRACFRSTDRVVGGDRMIFTSEVQWIGAQKLAKGGHEIPQNPPM